MARYRPGIETRQRIVDAARELLAEGGADGATVAAICQRAGIRPGSFYNLFDSKDQVVLTVVREAIEGVDPDPERAGTDTVAELLEAFIAFMENRPDLARIYIQIAVGGGSRSDHLHARVLRHHHSRVERFGAAMAREHPEMTGAEAHRRGELLVAALNGLALFTIIDPEYPFGSMARVLLKE